jgi:hypothetical protein
MNIPTAIKKIKCAKMHISVLKEVCRVGLAEWKGAKSC